MKSIIENSLSQSHSFRDYRNHIKDLLKEGKSSGIEQSEALTHYSELNETRMNRLEKTINIAIKNVQKLQQLKHSYIWLVISEGWCGDAAQILPVIYKMTLLSDKIDLKIDLNLIYDSLATAAVNFNGASIEIFVSIF